VLFLQVTGLRCLNSDLLRVPQLGSVLLTLCMSAFVLLRAAGAAIPERDSSGGRLVGASTGVAGD
jgi:hypothetical protein